MGGAQYVETPFAVDQEGVQSVPMPWDFPGGEVNDHFRALERASKNVWVEDGSLVQPERSMASEGTEILNRAMGQVVYSPHGVATLHQPFGQVRAHKAGHAGDRNFHKALVYRVSAQEYRRPGRFRLCSMDRILTVVGARPQFVKAAPLVAALRKRFEHILLHTGQHFDDAMSGAFFRELGIPKPQIDLGIAGGSHGAMTGAMLAAIEAALTRVKPSLVVVLGDTNSTLAGALAATKLHIPVAHVEAGLRSFDMKMPEEVNRRVTDHVSSLLFCPTRSAAANLAREGIRDGVVVVGDVMTDVLKKMKQPARAALRKMDLPRDFYFATVHRQENTDDRSRLEGILEGLGRLSYPVVLPLHPRTLSRLKKFKLSVPASIRTMGPVSYAQSLGLSLGARAVLTDSGGLQKEAFLLKKPCLTLRDTTEWTETLKGGANRLVGAKPESIVRAVRTIERNPPKVNPGVIYGDGRSAERIARTLKSYLDR